MSFTWIFQGGKKKVDVTSITLASDTAKIVDTTVPTGKRWFLLGVKMTNPDSVARTCSAYIFKEAAKTNYSQGLFSVSLATVSIVHWPDSATGSVEFVRFFSLIIMDPGETISCQWATGGASAGGTASDGLVIEYLEVDI